ncbi:MAG: hypothetical protein VB068_03605, partial [Petrimonas sp.]|nr:hypothetical protein [Petrimonas sp.]
AICLALTTLFAFMATAHADVHSFSSYTKVRGDDSQDLAESTRQQPERIDLYVSAVTWNGQSGWKIRGYNASNGTSCTVRSSVTGTGSNLAWYDTKPTTVKVKTSISSSEYDDYLEFKGSLYI